VKIIYAFTVLATAMTAASEAHAYETSPQPLTRADCAMAGQAWNDGANVCDSNLEVSNSTPAEDRAESVAQPLTRTACDKAGLAWDESANVCGSQAAPSRVLTEQATEMPSQPLTRAACSEAGMEWNERTNVCGKATELQTMGGVLPQIIPTEDTTGQPLTRAICEAAKMQWNESSNVCGAGSMPFAAQQSAAAETPAQPLTRVDCVKAGLTWNESTNVCGKTERKASTVKAVPVAIPKPSARAEHAKSTEATKKSAKKTYTKRRMTSRRQVQSAPTVPVERRPFRLFRKRPSATQ
jgi:hypothetical protein